MASWSVQFSLCWLCVMSLQGYTVIRYAVNVVRQLPARTLGTPRVPPLSDDYYERRDGKSRVLIRPRFVNITIESSRRNFAWSGTRHICAAFRRRLAAGILRLDDRRTGPVALVRALILVVDSTLADGATDIPTCSGWNRVPLMFRPFSGDGP